MLDLLINKGASYGTRIGASLRHGGVIGASEPVWKLCQWCKSYAALQRAGTEVGSSMPFRGAEFTR